MPAQQRHKQRGHTTRGIAGAFAEVLGEDLSVRVDFYDKSSLGPTDAKARVIVRSPKALRYIMTSPGQLGFGRAYVSGEIDFEGSIFDILALHKDVRDLKLGLPQFLKLVRLSLRSGLPLPPPKPPEEVRIRGRKHSKARDAAAVSHHYNVSNRFYEMVLGPTMTYSCAVWPSPDVTLEQAQSAKYELVCRKLGLKPGMRLLDVGCGWGGMVLYAARHYGVDAVGVTLSKPQAEWARRAVEQAGLSDRIDIRVQDYRDISDGPFEAISSIGMFEHVGLSMLDKYIERLYALLTPEGRLLNHGISRPQTDQHPRLRQRSFINRFVFPDGELHEVGSVVSHVQQAGFEARHVESLREHYALTLRKWVENLEGHWDQSVAEVGAGRARVWLLYMAASALLFELNEIQVHQVLAVKTEAGVSGFSLRPDWDTEPLDLAAIERGLERKPTLSPE